MAGAPRIITIRVPAVEATTAFQIQFAPSGSQAWTLYNPGDPDISVSELDANLDYVLDGVNSPLGNAEAASLEATWYQIRLKSGILYGSWLPPFRVGAPTAYDLQLFLESAGLTVGTLDLNAAVMTAFDAFNTATGRSMLAQLGTRTFDPPSAPSGTLDLREDLAGNPVSLTVGNTTYVLGTGYRMLGQNAAAQGKPFWAVSFQRYWTGPWVDPWWGSVSIEGYWGYALTLPNDAWEAILAMAAGIVAPLLSISVAGGLVRWVEAEVTEEYGVAPYATQIKMWATMSEMTQARYRRVQVGIGG